METLRLCAVIGEDHKMTITLPPSVPAGPVDVVVVVAPSLQPPVKPTDFYGIGRDLRTEQDPQDHVNELRDEWER
jgi:hypothetical protein